MAAKTTQRLSVIATNVARNLMMPAVNILLSWLVIMIAGSVFWGSFVEYLIAVGLSATLLGWGNKEYLLRAFSETPAAISGMWQQSILTRSILAIGPIALFFVLYDAETALWLAIWLLGMFVWQSFDVVIVYTRRFTVSIIADVLSFCLIAGAIYLYQEQMSVTLLLAFFALATWLKSFILMIWLGGEVFKYYDPKWNGAYFGAAFFFFLIGLSGMLQSKTDLYLVNFTLSNEATGRYQVIINLFIYMQAVAGFVLMPFARNLYRSKAATTERIAMRMLGLGVLMLIVALPATFLLLHYGYHFDLSWDYFAYGALFVVPVFWYLPYIILLYKHKKERQVMLINFAGAIVNLGFTWWLVQHFDAKGALMGSAIAQWFLLGIYLVYRRGIKEELGK
jgi:O-antigen/teichoic acid export membrane protein